MCCFNKYDYYQPQLALQKQALTPKWEILVIEFFPTQASNLKKMLAQVSF